MQILKRDFYVILLLYFISTSVETNLENKTFVPTKNWQTIEEGQAIPAGLHVRINLTTGKKEAKLLDNNNEESSSEIDELPNDNSTEQILETIDKPKTNKRFQTLQKFEKPTLSLDYKPEKFDEMRDRVKKSYKDYKELKKDLKDIKVNLKSDAELITGLFKDYNSTIKNSLGKKDILTILEDLNYLVHQIDNALWFIDSGGLDIIVRPMIVNQTFIDYRIASLRLLGALTQNNPKAQIKVYENNFGSYICNILFSSLDKNEISTGLYAFGSLLRKFPNAQKDLLSKLGIKALIEVLKKDTTINNKAKTLTLIGDLIQDQDNVINKVINTSFDLFQQYNEIELDIWLQENRFCKIVPDFIWTNRNELIRHPDIIDDIIESLRICQRVCSTVWPYSSLMKLTLKSLEDDLKISTTEYSIEVGQRITKFKEILFSKKLHLNDEF